jgi:hypothetical protein
MNLHLIGGSGSSGTTLLARLLDGLGTLRSGPELAVFHHRALYDTGPGFRARVYGLLTGRAPSLGMPVERLMVPLMPSVFFQDRVFYGGSSIEAELALLDAATDLGALVETLRQGMAKTLGVPADFTLIDQTPKNCVAALEFLETVPGGRFIHVVRDGRDVVRSLTRRWAAEAKGHGAATYVQAGMTRWTWDVSQALRAESHPGYLEVRYEKLVTRPLVEINRVLCHLGQAPVTQSALTGQRSPSLSASGERFHGGMKPTWGAQVHDPVTPRGIGRWREVFSDGLVDQMRRFAFTAPGDPTKWRMGPLLERFAWAP